MTRSRPGVGIREMRQLVPLVEAWAPATLAWCAAELRRARSISWLPHSLIDAEMFDSMAADDRGAGVGDDHPRGRVGASART